jgi:two-component system chemotaxis response regulator CheB
MDQTAGSRPGESAGAAPVQEASRPPGEAAEEGQRSIVVVGASAGGVEALARLFALLPPDLPAAVFVVLHMLSGGRSMLPEILARAGSLPVRPARDSEAIVTGHVYVAPPDHHMLVRDGRVHLNRGPRENGHRPAIDPLFRSAARAYGPGVLGVVLSGLLDDGAAGLHFIDERGGASIVQDPEDALFPAMPLAAMAATHVHSVATVEDMPRVILEMLREPVPATVPAGADEQELDRVELDPATTALVDGSPTPISCPVCGGAMWELHEGPLVRFACQTGHAFSPESLISEQGSAVEQAMWSALRSLDERAELFERMARRQTGTARARFEQRACDAQAHAASIRDVLLRAGSVEVPTEHAGTGRLEG